MTVQKLLKKLDIAFEDAKEGQEEFLKKMKKFKKQLGRKEFKKTVKEYRKSL